MNPYLELMRPKQWNKNLVIYIPMFFAGLYWESSLWLPLFVGFMALNLAASAGYILNDLLNVYEDRWHPHKCKRPLPSGRAKGEIAGLVQFSIAVVAISLSYWNILMALFVVLFLGSDVIYSFYARQHPPLDVAVIALKYPLRLGVGFAIIGQPINWWLVACQMGFIIVLTALTRKGDNRHRQSEAELTAIFLTGAVAMIVCWCVFVDLLAIHETAKMSSMVLMTGIAVNFYHLFLNPTYEETQSGGVLRNIPYMTMYITFIAVLYLAIYGVPRFV